MAHFALTDVSLVVNAVDLSDHVKDATLVLKRAMLDDTAMGDTSEGRIAGLKDWEFSCTFHQDFASGEVDATIYAAYNAGTPITMTGKPTSAAVGATNPTYSGSVLVEEYTPIGGSTGEKAMAPVKFAAAGDLTRATA